MPLPDFSTLQPVAAPTGSAAPAARRRSGSALPDFSTLKRVPHFASLKPVTVQPNAFEDVNTEYVGNPENESFEDWQSRLTPGQISNYGPSIGPTPRGALWKHAILSTLYKVFPGEKKGYSEAAQPSAGEVATSAAMLLPVGVPERLNKLLMGYFTAQTAAAQPGIVRNIYDELKNKNYSAAQRDAVSDALQLGMLGASAVSGHADTTEPNQNEGGQNATGKEQQQQSPQPQHSGNGEGGTPAQTGNSGGLPGATTSEGQTPQTPETGAPQNVGARPGENEAALPNVTAQPKPQLPKDLEDELSGAMEDVRRQIALKNTAEKRAADKGGRGANRPHIAARPDGVPDLLDLIQEEGGLKPPGPHAGPEYDGYNEAMVGPARLLRNKNASQSVDGMMQAAERHGYHFEKPDDFWATLKQHSLERQALPERMKREQKQADEDAANFDAWQASLNYHDNAVWSGNTKLADVTQDKKGNNMFMPTEEGLQLPEEYQQHVVDKFLFSKEGNEEGKRKKEKGKSPEPEAHNIVGNPAGKNLPDWAREEMEARGLDPKRPLNDIDIQDPNVRAAVQADPTLSDEEKENILKTGSAKTAGTEVEKVKAAAVRSADGTIYTGAWHPAAYDQYMKDKGVSKEQVINELKSGKLADGFVTTKGRFVDREEAAAIASKANQFKPDKEGDVAFAGGLKGLEKESKIIRNSGTPPESGEESQGPKAAAVKAGPQANKNGVYDEKDAEKIKYATKKASAEVRLLQIPRGWIMSTEVQHSQGNMSGYGEPLMTYRIFPNRQTALNAAVDRIIESQRAIVDWTAGSSPSDKQKVEAQKIIDWAQKLKGPQPPPKIHASSTGGYSPKRQAAESSSQALRERGQASEADEDDAEDLRGAIEDELPKTANVQAQQGRGPTAKPSKQWFAALRAAVNPMSLGDAAKDVATILRYTMGQRLANENRFDSALGKFRSMFDKQTTPRGIAKGPLDPDAALPANWRVQQAIDAGALEHLTPKEKEFAQLMRSMFDEAIAQIQRFKPDVLQDLYESYFPRAWVKLDGSPADELALRLARGHRPWEGPKSFLKARTLALWEDALKLGLRPKFDNPVDAVYAKLSEMWRFAGALEGHAIMKQRGIRRFRYIFERAPEGWVAAAPEDPSTKVYAPPVVTVKEAYDQMLRVKSYEMFKSLGVSHKRLMSLGGKRWGEAAGTTDIRSRFGGPPGVFWHEFGHIMDNRFADLRTALGLDMRIVQKNGRVIWRGSGIEDKELRALADQRLPMGDTGERTWVNQKTGKTMKGRSGFSQYTRRTEEKMANVFEAYVHAPELFRKVAPNVFSKLTRWLEKHPEVKGPLNDIRPSLKLGTATSQMRLQGPVLLGEWMMPPDAAQVLRNYLSPSVWGNVKSLSALKRLGGIMSNVRLISLFHGQMVSNDALASGLSLPLYDAMKAVSDKRPELLARAAQDFMLAPVRPALALYQGHKMIRELHQTPLVGPGTLDQELTRMAVDANLRTGHIDHVDNASRRWRRALYEAANAVKAGRPGQAAGPLWSAFWQTPLMVSHEMMRPVMEWFVPRMKYGLFAPMAMRVIRDNPGADEMTLRRLMGKAADSVEDRVGQVTYDNMFLARAVKDSGQLGLQAFGWHATKERMLWGAASDYFKAGKALLQGKRPEVTFRMTYLPSMVVTHALTGAIIMYALTGRRPKSLIDYLFPETGLVDQYGRPVRLAIADFMKDYLSEFQAAEAGPKATVQLWERRLMPVWNTLADMYRNRDFWNTRIFSERKFGESEWQHLWDNLKEAATYAATGNQPFSAKGAEYFKQDLSGRATAIQKVLAYAGPYFGFVPAPQAVTQSPAQARAAEIMREGAPPKDKSQEQQALLMAQLVHDLRTGRINDAGALRARERAAGIDPNTKDGKIRMAELKKRVLWTPLQYQVSKLPLYQPGGSDAMSVWDLMADSEKRQTAPLYKDKILRAFKGGGIDKDTAVRLMRAVVPFLGPAKQQQPAPAAGYGAPRSAMNTQ